MTVAQIGRGPLVDAPTPAKRTGGLLDVADVREGVSWMDGVDMFTSWNCVDVSFTALCLPDSTPTKVFTAPTVVDGTNFVAYLGGKCKPLGTTAGLKSDVAQVFDLRESKAVEKAFEAAVLVNGVVPPVLVPGNTGPVAALASIEQALAAGYAGVGTIHMSPALATGLLAFGLIVESGGKFFTNLGTKVVVGAGYQAKAMYGTGDVVVFRGPRQVTDAPNIAQNETSVLAERAYVAVADCVVYKVTDATVASPAIGDPVVGSNAVTGTDTVEGPGGSWTPPPGNLRSVSIVVTSGSVEIEGDEVTAPNTVNFDADTGESLAFPSVTANSAGDRAVVAWVVIP